MNDQIKANATVDKIKDGPMPTWEVIVTGLPPYDRTRTYTLVKKSDKDAAFAGIDLFCEEMLNLNSVSDII